MCNTIIINVAKTVQTADDANISVVYIVTCRKIVEFIKTMSLE